MPRTNARGRGRRQNFGLEASLSLLVIAGRKAGRFSGHGVQSIMQCTELGVRGIVVVADTWRMCVTLRSNALVIRLDAAQTNSLLPTSLPLPCKCSAYCLVVMTVGIFL